MVVDGTGREPFTADVRLIGATVAEVGPDLDRSDAVVVGLRGMVVAPGFIDMHAHSEGAIWRQPTHLPKVAQGVTFELLGQDGLGFAPVLDHGQLSFLADRLTAWHGSWEDRDLAWTDLASFGAALSGRGLGLNVGFLVPHGTLRVAVGAIDAAPATPNQVSAMRDLLATAMGQGAFGWSTGLVYEPARHADTNELVALGSVVGRNGVFVPHIRSYHVDAFDAYREAIDIATRAGAPLHLTHALLNGSENAGRADSLVSMMVDTSERVTADVYPYDAGSTYLHVFLPPGVSAGTTEEVSARLSDPSTRSAIVAATSHLDWERVVMAGVENPQLGWTVGLSVAAVARHRDCSPVEAYCWILTDDRLSSTCLHFNGNWENVVDVIRAPNVCVASDSILVGERPHPRGWGTFARFIERFVATGDLAIGPAIHKVTGLPASVLGMTNRGAVRAGAVADLVCFDPASVRDRSSFEAPRALAEGFEYVFVRGQPVLWQSEPTGRLAGEVVWA